MSEKTIKVLVPETKEKVKRLQQELEKQKQQNQENIQEIANAYNVEFDTDLFSSIKTIQGMKAVALEMDKQRSGTKTKKPSGKAYVKAPMLNQDSLRTAEFENAEVATATLMGILEDPSHPDYAEALEIMSEFKTKECHTLEGFVPENIMEFENVPQGLQKSFTWREYNEYMKKKYGKEGETVFNR